MHTWIELCANCFHGLYAQTAKRLLHLLQDEINPRAELPR